jgi:enoyl-[acyl-carrier protein] reductase/trans-2-enoyl-CoA reductase (NAD+)
MAELEVFEKLPLGGMNIREIPKVLEAEAPALCARLLKEQVEKLKPQGATLPEGHVVLLLGGSNGILRAVAVQLLFGEKIPVYAVHYDRRMMVGAHHVKAITDLAAERGIDTRWFNADATEPKIIDEVIAEIQKKYKVVHLINGIAAGATKRYKELGAINVPDLDVAYHPVLQYPDFSSSDNIRNFGLVEVPLADDTDIEKTNKFMGSSTTLWAEPLAKAGLIARGTSIVAFADYDFEKDDPVYGMGPLAGAKILQRESMAKVREKFGAKTVRLCYPAMDTTAIGAIPGGLIMFALSTQVLAEDGKFKNLMQLAEETMEIFKPGYDKTELLVDAEFQACLPEMHRREPYLTKENIKEHLHLLPKLDLP